MVVQIFFGNPQHIFVSLLKSSVQFQNLCRSRVLFGKRQSTFLLDEQKATKCFVCCYSLLLTESHYFFLLDSPKFTLEPKLPSRNPTAGFPVTLTWNVSGIPKPEVTWKNPSGENVSADDPRFLLGEGKLTIASLEEKDAGMWTLEATNPLQTTTTNVVFDIIYGK